MFNERTDVHSADAQVFRAIKALGSEMQANKLEAARAHGALKLEVAEVKKDLAENTKATARVEGKIDVLLADRRSASPSSQRNAAKEVLAEQVLAEQRSKSAFSRKVWLILIGGAVTLVTSGAFVGWALGKL